LACDVPAVAGWDGLEKLWKYLERHWSALCLLRVDGPDARRWVVGVRDAVLELEFEEPWGNRLISSSPSCDRVLIEIFHDLQQRLSDA
jgi:hypothetical protein